MKRGIFLAAVATLFAGALLFAEESPEDKPFFYERVVKEIDRPQAPFITDEYIVFTADSGHRYVGIAFDFENFQVIHPFKILHTRNVEGEITNEVLFYCYEQQHKLNEIKYRLVIDGLWTIDPHNPDTYYDSDINLYFSRVRNLGEIETITGQKESDLTRFIYKGESGLNLHLAGTFTNWDPWIYQMNETAPGFYELELPLPRGKYYYNYFVGLTPILDSTNPRKEYTSDGRATSVIEIF